MAAGQKSVLVVDDEFSSRELLGMILEDGGYDAVLVESGMEAMRRVEEQVFDAVVTDLQMPGMDGSAVVRELHAREEDLPVIVLTAFGTPENAFELGKQGAFAFIKKPFDKNDLLLQVDRAIEYRHLKSELRALRTTLKKQRDELGIIGQSKGIRDVLDQVNATARTDFPVVIYGESGTGKEMIAHSIHLRSNRANKPFVVVNCGAIPEELFENELFGHVRGAYTGAQDTRKGLFEEAHGGSIFLDEIGEIPLALQAKLLRVLQNREVRKVGDTRSVLVDVRLISATNKDLEAAVEDGEFRQDLYYRINVIPIHMPPLRERVEDIPLLAMHFLEQANRSLERKKAGFTHEAQRRLREYGWPGNVRELENKVKQSAIVATGELVDGEDIQLSLESSGPPPALRADIGGVLEVPTSYREAKSRFERAYLLALLQRHKGNVSRAAKEAGRYRAELYKDLKKHGIDPAAFRDE